MLYQVAGWDKHFEGAKSKTYNNKSTCQMPTKHSLGYRRLVRRENGAAIFGAWCAMIQVLSRHEKPRQGYCTDTGRIDGRPLTDSDLEMLTDIPAAAFAAMFQVCASEDVAWLLKPQGYHKDTTVSAQYPLDSDLDLDLDSIAHSRFDEFWDAYPVKKGKKKANEKWKRKGLDAIADVILADIANRLNNDRQWQDGFIPHGSTYVNNEVWNDDIQKRGDNPGEVSCGNGVVKRGNQFYNEYGQQCAEDGLVI